MVVSEPRADREEGDGGLGAGEREEQKRAEDQGPRSGAPVEGEVQEAAEGAGGC